MLVTLKDSNATRIYLCGRIIEADNGRFEVSEEEYALNEAVLEPVDKKAGKVIKPKTKSTEANEVAADDAETTES